jgi:NADH dehydrogenase [ubiquinone] 1 alpha subcomplex assembly factor 7
MTPLEREINALVAAEGPIPIDRYMALCLGHPVHGYYATRDPFGAAGDFVTAPEMSQMFGELLGLWAAAVFESMGRPEKILLVELGPGRGTLMADALRAARVLPAFADAIDVHLVETSPVLRERQRAALAGRAPVAWHERIEDLPGGPAIVVANEFFDALPIRQFVRTEAGWRERLVGVDADGQLAFGVAPHPAAGFMPPPIALPAGALVEVPEAAIRCVRSLGARLAAEGGAMLLIDYGYDGFATADTLQAVRRHRPVDPLDAPGTADLTAHVPFGLLAAAARGAGAAAYGPVTQADFLDRLGLSTRAERLAAAAGAGQRAAVATAAQRLTERSPTGMGSLFRALAIADPRLPEPPGFTG